MRRKISADVDGGLSGVSRCADTGARTPIGVSGISLLSFFSLSTAIQLVTLSTCILIRINSATTQSGITWTSRIYYAVWDNLDQ